LDNREMTRDNREMLRANRGRAMDNREDNDYRNVNAHRKW